MLKKNTKRGFTLVELLVTIVLLGIVAAIVIYNMTSVSKTSKETEYERFVAAVKSAAGVYADLNKEAFNDLYVSKAYIYIKVEDLVKSGTLKEDLKNPYTEKNIGLDELIKANLDNVSGDLKFEYPLESEEKETFLVALSDYVVWGEGYDCMQGAGSYQLSLSKENGDLIMLDSEEERTKYNFACSMPENFNKEEAGNYEVEYTWLTESGTRKRATRVLRVLPKVKPSFKVKTNDGAEYNYNFESGEWYTPSYNEATNKWTYLTYTPYIEGADADTTLFYVSKKANEPAGSVVDVTAGYTNKYETYPVDDGNKTYIIKTKIKGHHDTSYEYEASGEENIRSKLVIPTSFISGDSKVWATNKTFSVKEPHSPVGVTRYEYKLVKDASVSISNDDKRIDANRTFNKTATVTSKNVSIYDNAACKMIDSSYYTIYFRAINRDGYVGDWTHYKDAYITNKVNDLISNGASAGSIRIRVGNKDFTYLEKNGRGQITATYNDVSTNRVTPTATNRENWTVVNCDGTFSVNYDRTATNIREIINELNRFVATMPNYSEYLVYQNWPNIGNMYAGTVNQARFNQYPSLLRDASGKPYWVTDTYTSAFEIYVEHPYRHGDHQTRYNSYFYAIENGSLTTRYAGSSAYVKPLVMFDKIYACSGNGTAGSPFVIATTK